MAPRITHAKVSGRTAGNDPNRVYGTDWDADHTISGLTIGTDVPAHDATLDALAQLDSTTGLVTETGADTFAKRTLTGTANRVAVTNGDGSAGNPTVDIDAAYVGQATITTLGTLTTGTWHATVIQAQYGGTGVNNGSNTITVGGNLSTAGAASLPAIVQGDLWYGSAAGTISALAKNSTATRYLANTGTSNNANWDQINLSNGVTSALGLGNGGTGQTTALAARGSSGINEEGFTGHGDSIYTILATDRVVGTNAAFTASRTWTLPAANAVNTGGRIIVADFQGTVTSVNTLVISRAGSDTINGGTSVTISSANGAYLLISDGSSKWTAQALGSASGVTSVGGLSGVIGLGTGLGTSASNIILNASTASNSLGADVNLNNTANYFDGPSAAQGTSGTWLASGTVTIQDTSGTAAFAVKLWDGTTVISSCEQTASGGAIISVSLSGILTSPASNIRISVKDLNFTTGKILFNATGNSKDSTITCVRIG